MNQRVFSDAIPLYHGAQWPAIIPVPPDKKYPPPVGFTGETGADTSPQQLVTWAASGFADFSVALRMPEGVIGIDVDHYLTGEQQKTGNDTLEARIAVWGPLPATWHSTARGDDTGSGPSRIMFFRAPAGRYRNSLPDIDIIQRHHRYAVVAPSPHGSVPGAFYRWYRPSGEPAAPGEVPRPDQLPELPEPWVQGLREGATGAGLAAADIGSGHTMLAALMADDREPCAEVVGAYDFALRELQAADGGTRHDTMAARVHRLVLAGASGHPGVGPGLADLVERWAQLTSGENRAGEFDNMLLTSARKAVSQSGPVPVDRDPCLLMGRYGTGNPATGHAAGPPTGGGQFTAPVGGPVDDRDAEDAAEPLPEPIEAPEPWSWIEGIGAHPFDPGLDRELRLADAVLERTWPMLRYVTDAKDTWLQRGPRCWELFRGINRRAVTECARLMPDGDPDLPSNKTDYTRAHWQSVRKAKLHTNGPINNVATLMQTTVAGGRHPNAVRLADLDARPDVLWAGGMAYDIRASAQGPAFAVDIDANTPHLMSAGVRPELVPTPAWDAFLAAVWPDPEVRAWAMRVLSIAVTGEADAALPILLGPGGTGKTSVVHLIMSLLGSYAHAANPKLLMAGDNSHDTIVYELKGRRLSFIDEGPREGRLAQERLKQLTGGGMLTGRPMNTDPFTFAPTHSLVLTANDEPLLTDEALRRRVRLIPCAGDTAAVAVARGRLVGPTWRREAPGALAQIMAEAARWYAEPATAKTLAAPGAIRSLAEEMAVGQDPFREWFDEALEPCTVGTPASTLRDAHNAWAERVVGRWARRLNHRTFAKAMRGLGYESQPRRDCNYYLVRFRGTGAGPFGAPTPPGQAGQPPVAVVAVVRGGSEVTTPTDQNTRSTTFSSPSEEVVGVKEVTIYKEEEGTTPYGVVPRKYGAEVEKHPQHPQLIFGSDKKDGLPAAEQVADVPAEAPQTGPEHGDHGQLIFDQGIVAGQPPCREIDDLGHTPTTPPLPKAPRGRLTDEEKAERAAARKAAKAAEKAALRVQAVTDAGGGHHELPVVVDRAGLVLPCSPEQARELVAAGIAAHGSLTVDVETSGYPVGHAEHVLRTVQLGHAGLAVVFDPTRHAEQIRALLDLAPKLHAHSATADLVPLVHAGLIGDIEHAWDRMHDTVIPAKLADPASTGSDPGLKQLAGVVLGEAATAPAADVARKALFTAAGWLTDTEVDTPVERSGWAQVDSGCAVMARYAASDVLDTAALALRLPPVDDAGLYGRERLAQRLTARVAHRGLRLDPGHVAEMTRIHREGQAATAERVRAHGDIDNPGSTAQVAAKVVSLGGSLPQTATGKPSAAKDALEPLRAAEGALGAFVGDVLAYRHHSTALSLFLTPYGHLCERGDGRVRPTVYTLGTDTGRMSCVESTALVEMPRDLSKYPNGVPITEVKAGDWVYAFDHHRELVLRRVKWCEQTAVRQTMIITAENSDGHTITLRATPEHLIRLRNGDWRATDRLLETPGTPRRDRRPRLMTMVRRDVDQGYVKFFPHSVARYGAGVKGGGKSREHRWIVEQMTGKRLSTKTDVDHIDGNRANNHPDNLRPLSVHEHRGNRSLAWSVAQPDLDLYCGPTDYHVVSVQPGPIEPVWDMEVEEVHNFIANGICVHNCVRPNLQQLSRKGGMRACITADPGQLLISADFSGVELRVAAAVSGDPTLVQMLADNRDLHMEVAKMAFGPEASKNDRAVAKRAVFGRLYGGGIPALARQVGVSESIMAAIVASLDEITPVLAQWSSGMRRAVQQGHTQYPSYSGRTIHLPRAFPHKSPNYVIQGTARELLIDALVRWSDTPWGTCTLVPVHDELIVAVPETQADDALAELERCMTSEINGIAIVAESDPPMFAWQDVA